MLTINLMTPEVAERLAQNFGRRVLGEIRAGIVQVIEHRVPGADPKDVSFVSIKGEVNGKLLDGRQVVRLF